MSSEKKVDLGRLLRALGPFIGLVLVYGLFAAIGPPQFTSFENFRLVSSQTMIVGLGAIGMTFIVVSGGIDLSVGSVIALASVVTALLAKAGYSAPVSLMGGVLAGGTCGALNGLLITSLRIVPFIATLGMFGIARGFAKYLAGVQKVDAPTDGISALTAKVPDPAWILFPRGVWMLFLLGVVMAVVLRRTTFGTHTFAIGSNEATARLCGVPVARTKVLLYMVGGLFAGLAGVIQFGRISAGDPTAALGMELNVIAAVVIGGGSLSGGEGRIFGSLVGALMMTFLDNGCTMTDVPNYVQEIAIGAIIVAAVSLDRFWHR
jgi:ribose transport system permease protein